MQGEKLESPLSHSKLVRPGQSQDSAISAESCHAWMQEAKLQAISDCTTEQPSHLTHLEGVEELDHIWVVHLSQYIPFSLHVIHLQWPGGDISWSKTSQGNVSIREWRAMLTWPRRSISDFLSFFIAKILPVCFSLQTRTCKINDCLQGPPHGNAETVCMKTFPYNAS